MGHPLAREAADLVFRGLGAGLGDDPGAHLLAVFRVGHAEHLHELQDELRDGQTATLTYRRMLAGIDLTARATGSSTRARLDRRPTTPRSRWWS